MLLNFARTRADNKSGPIRVRVSVQMFPQRENTLSTGADEAGALRIWMATMVKAEVGWAMGSSALITKSTTASVIRLCSSLESEHNRKGLVFFSSSCIFFTSSECAVEMCVFRLVLDDFENEKTFLL